MIRGFIRRVLSEPEKGEEDDFLWIHTEFKDIYAIHYIHGGFKDPDEARAIITYVNGRSETVPSVHRVTINPEGDTPNVLIEATRGGRASIINSKPLDCKMEAVFRKAYGDVRELYVTHRC